MQSAMERSCFVFGLCCVSRVFGLSASLSANLQSHNFDLAQCITARWPSVQRSKGNAERCSKWIFITSCRGPINGELHRLRSSSNGNVINKSIGIHMEHRTRRHIIDCPHIYPSLVSLYTSFRIDFSNIAAYCAASAPCYRTAPHCGTGKNRRWIDLQHAPRQISGGFLDCFGGHVQSRAANVEHILGRKKPQGTTPQLYRKLELLRCSHFPICLHSTNNCGMYCSDRQMYCTAIILHIEKTTNLPEEYNGRGAPQRSCTNERS